MPLFLSLLLILFSYILVSTPRLWCFALSVLLRLFHRCRSFQRGWQGSTEPARNQLWNFSNLSVILRFLLCPGKLIIEIYRKTRSWPGWRDLFVFRTTIVSYCSGHQDFTFFPPVCVRLSSLFCWICLHARPVTCLVNSFPSILSIYTSMDISNPRIGRASSALNQPFRRIVSFDCRDRRVSTAYESIEGSFHGFWLVNLWYMQWFVCSFIFHVNYPYEIIDLHSLNR